MVEAAQDRRQQTETFAGRPVDVVHLGGMAVVGRERGKSQGSSIAENEDRRPRRMPDEEPVMDLQQVLTG